MPARIYWLSDFLAAYLGSLAPSGAAVDLATAYRHAGYRAAGLWTADTLAELIPARALAHPERELFCFEGTRITYGAFEAWTRQVALDLARRGVRPGDRVLVQLPNRLEALTVQVAAFRAGRGRRAGGADLPRPRRP